ncbi:MAG: methyltransferase domain-containing protein [Actinobacteria bacterium]|nr:MAG: methyltransferase domain-containing protein [Actinomycetota bacterium]
MSEDRKQAEVDYPAAIGEEGRRWLRTKPFGNNSPRETARLVIDFGYVVQLLDLQPGMRFVELGCGPGWMSRFAARHGVEAVGYDIAPQMIEIAREQAVAEGVSRSATWRSSTSAGASTRACSTTRSITRRGPILSSPPRTAR